MCSKLFVFYPADVKDFGLANSLIHALYTLICDAVRNLIRHEYIMEGNKSDLCTQGGLDKKVFSVFPRRNPTILDL